MAIELRLLTPANCDVLQNIAPDLFDNAIDPTQLGAFLEDPRHLMCIVVENETVVGMASAVEHFHPDKAPQLFINEVGVASTHRKQGIGRALVEALIETARERGCVYAWLGTGADNAAGQACFASVPGVEEAQAFLLYEWNLEE